MGCLPGFAAACEAALSQKVRGVKAARSLSTGVKGSKSGISEVRQL
jgi:hypothetical protein